MILHKTMKLCRMTILVALSIATSLSLVVLVDAFSMTASSGMNGDKRIYGIPNSGWQSPRWNWGSAVGTGHDCAMVCRQQYGTPESRRALIDNLMNDPSIPADFEEIKLVLALAWQRGRWDNRDGGPNGGYREVLQYLVEADRYEVTAATGNGGEDPHLRFAQDMQARYPSLQPSPTQRAAMESLFLGCGSDINRAQRRCSGLVLEAMGFVEHGC